MKFLLAITVISAVAFQAVYSADCGGKLECVPNSQIAIGCNNCTCNENGDNVKGCTKIGCFPTNNCINGDEKTDNCTSCVCCDGFWVCLKKQRCQQLVKIIVTY